MPSLQSILLRFVARNVQSIVDFVVALDARLDKFLLDNDAEVAAKEKEIADLAKQTADRISEIESEISEKVKAAGVILGIKNSLPKGD